MLVRSRSTFAWPRQASACRSPCATSRQHGADKRPRRKSPPSTRCQVGARTRYRARDRLMPKVAGETATRVPRKLPISLAAQATASRSDVWPRRLTESRAGSSPITRVGPHVGTLRQHPKRRHRGECQRPEPDRPAALSVPCRWHAGRAPTPTTSAHPEHHGSAPPRYPRWRKARYEMRRIARSEIHARGRHGAN